MTFGLPWNLWEPIYEAILADFGYDRQEDERARDELATLTEGPVLSPNLLPDLRGQRVAIAGGAPSLERELARIQTVDIVISASTGTERLERQNIDVALHVTDLDKDEEHTVERTLTGRPVAIHAHGDNRNALARNVSRMDGRFVLPTTQAAPVNHVLNPGGFTDGDRAAFLADALGAEELVFVGWDFDDPTVGREKSKKLRWAERLLHWLELRRDDRFSILDSRREGIDLSDLPMT